MQAHMYTTYIHTSTGMHTCVNTHNHMHRHSHTYTHMHRHMHVHSLSHECTGTCSHMLPHAPTCSHMLTHAHLLTLTHASILARNFQSFYIEISVGRQTPAQSRAAAVGSSPERSVHCCGLPGSPPWALASGPARKLCISRRIPLSWETMLWEGCSMPP